MRCPFCNYEDTKVIDSRPSEGKKGAGANVPTAAEGLLLMR